MSKDNDLFQEAVNKLYDSLSISVNLDDTIEKAIENYWKLIEQMNQEVELSSF